MQTQWRPATTIDINPATIFSANKEKLK